MVSATIRIIELRPKCIVMKDEKTLDSFSLSPFPNSNVINQEIAADNDPDSMENMATTPPTTL